MASTKVGDGLAYQAAVRWAEGRCCRRRWSARVVQEKSPIRIGVVPGNGQVRPLALGLHAQMRPHLLEGDLQLPAQHKPFQDLRRVRRRIGAEQGLGSEFALWVPNQDPAQGHRRLARAVPDRRLRGEFHRAGSAVVPGCRHLNPWHGGQVQECLQRGQASAFQRRAAVLPRLTGWRWRVQGGVQAQAGDEGNGLSQRLAAVEQVQDGVAAVAHQHQGAVGQPAAQLPRLYAKSRKSNG